ARQVPITEGPPSVIAWVVADAARAVARGRPEMILPPEAAPLLAALLPELTRPTALRFATLLAAALLPAGCRIGANLLRTLRHLPPSPGRVARRAPARAAPRPAPHAGRGCRSATAAGGLACGRRARRRRPAGLPALG